jgi:hypothetical protein
MYRQVRPEKLREQMSRDGSLAQVAMEIREIKCIDKILESAKITEVKPKIAEEKPKKAEPKPIKKAAAKKEPQKKEEKTPKKEEPKKVTKPASGEQGRTVKKPSPKKNK